MPSPSLAYAEPALPQEIDILETVPFLEWDDSQDIPLFPDDDLVSSHQQPVIIEEIKKEATDPVTIDWFRRTPPPEPEQTETDAAKEYALLKAAIEKTAQRLEQESGRQRQSSQKKYRGPAM